MMYIIIIIIINVTTVVEIMLHLELKDIPMSTVWHMIRL